jgi:hypothetical protein
MFEENWDKPASYGEISSPSSPHLLIQSCLPTIKNQFGKINLVNGRLKRSIAC